MSENSKKILKFDYSVFEELMLPESYFAGSPNIALAEVQERIFASKLDSLLRCGDWALKYSSKPKSLK